MTTTKHPPGPWRQDEWRNGTSVRITGADRRFVAWLEGLDAKNAECQAGVRLIAAAPRLLAALAGMLAIVDDSQAVAGYHLNGELEPWDGFPEIEEARAAIAEATGEQS